MTKDCGGDFLKKIFKLALSQIAETKCMFILVIAEMIIALVTFNIAFSGVYDLWVKDAVYNHMNLSKAVAFTLTDYNGDTSETYERLKKDNRFTLLGETQTAFTDSQTYVVPLSNDYIDNINQPDIKGEWFSKTEENILSAVISHSLTDKYKIGSIYKITINGKESDIYISGALNSDYMFLPPNGAGDIITKNSNLILVDSNESITSKSAVITAYINCDIDEGINILNSYNEIRDVVSVSSAKANDAQVQLRENSIPIILTIVVILMCIAGFTSYNVLSLIRKEKQFAVFFLTGATRKKCVIIKLIEDIITISLPMIISLSFLFLLKSYGLENAFCNPGIIISIILCILIFFITSFSGLLRLSNKEPIEIIRQWQV